MKLEIYQESDPIRAPEKILRLKLIHAYERVSVVAVDAKGVRLVGGYLVNFTPDGYLTLGRNVSSNIPIVTNSEGQIIIKD